MIEEAPSILNTWIQDWNLLSENWRVGLVVFALVAGTAVVAYIASFIVGAVERRFQKTDNLWDDALLHAARNTDVAELYDRVWPGIPVTIR